MNDFLKPQYKRPPQTALVPAAEAPPATIHKGDGLQWLRTLPAGYATCMLTDPPYCSGGALPANKVQSTGNKYFTKEGDTPSFIGDSMGERVYLNFMTDIFIEVARIMRGGAVFVFTDWRMYPTIRDSMQRAGLTPKGMLVWDKKNGRSVPNNFSRVFELVEYAHVGSAPNLPEPVFLKGIWQETIDHKTKLHQTMKPPGLLRELIKLAPHGRVIDPFAGAGSSLLAALQSGRPAAGADIDAYYHNMAIERLRADGYSVNENITT